MGHQGTPGLDSLSGGVSVQFPPQSTPGLCSLSGGVQRTLQGNNLYFNDPFSSTNSSNLSSLRTLSLTTCRFLLISLFSSQKTKLMWHSILQLETYQLLHWQEQILHLIIAKRPRRYPPLSFNCLQDYSWQAFKVFGQSCCLALSESASPPCLGPGSVITVIGQRYWPALLRLWIFVIPSDFYVKKETGCNMPWFWVRADI